MKAAQVAKPQPAVKAEEGTANPNENGPQSKGNPLEGIAAKLLDGRLVGGYSLIPAKKVKGNHQVVDTGRAVILTMCEWELKKLLASGSVWP